ncbi:hypothetical protein D3C73_1129740 [compost metagenome]
MSVRDFDAALAARTQTKLAIVSGQLLIDLQTAGRLLRDFRTVRVPADPTAGKVIDAWLRSEGVDPSQPIRVWYTQLATPRILVDEDIVHGMTLVPSGPGSFDLR